MQNATGREAQITQTFGVVIENFPWESSEKSKVRQVWAGQILPDEFTLENVAQKAFHRFDGVIGH